jgi:deazaflavin-dependent oxidoreductase (nitroreductase family)
MRVGRPGRDQVRQVMRVVAALVQAVLVIVLVYVIGLRSKSSAVRNAARRFHRSVGNPLQMRRAGGSETFASVIVHRGRTTGKTYETPVWAVPTEDGFVIAIVYGSRTEWVKNVLASRSATLVRRGGTFAVDRPEVVPRASVRAYFPAAIRRIHGRVHVDSCIRVRLADVLKLSTEELVTTRGRL